MRRRYTASDFEPHIKGSGGIISTIAEKAGCSWRTVDVWLKKNAALRSLYEGECETALDLAESVILNNILAAAKMQEDAEAAGLTVIVDSADAKWLLARKGKRRGYGETAEIDVKVGPGPIAIREIRVHLPEID